MFVCKSCGKILDIEDYNESQKLAKSKLGCLFWFIMIMFCITLIMIPVVIFLYLIWKRQAPQCVCPYCLSKNSIIPADTPLGTKILNENYTQEEILAMDVQSSKQERSNDKWTLISKYVLIFWIILIVLAAIFLH